MGHSITHGGLTPGNKMLGVTVVLSLISLAILLWPRFKRLLKMMAVPGPLLPRSLKGNLEDYMNQPRTFGPSMMAKHGPLYRVYINNFGQQLAIGDPAIAQQLYTDQANMDKPADGGLGDFLERYLKDCLGCASGRKWVNIKSGFRVTMSVNAANDSLANIEASIDQWEEGILEPLAKSGEAVTLTEMIGMMPVTAMLNIFFGHQFISRNMKKLVSLNDDADELMKTVLYDKLACNSMYKYLPTSANKTLARFRQNWEKIILDYEKNPERMNGEGGTLDSTIDFIDAKKKDAITFNQVVDTMSEIIFTNQDVLGPAITWMFTDMVVYPKYVDWLELDTVSGMIDKTTLEKDHPKLLHVIKESARVHPFLPLSIPEILSKDVELNGYTLPKGSVLSIDQYSFNQNPKYWPQPREFKPERFENVDSFTDKWALFRMGFGSRRCPGQFYGNLVMANLMARFFSRWKMVPLEEVSHHEQVPVTPGNFSQMPNIKVCIQERTLKKEE